MYIDFFWPFDCDSWIGVLCVSVGVDFVFVSVNYCYFQIVVFYI